MPPLSATQNAPARYVCLTTRRASQKFAEGILAKAMGLADKFTFSITANGDHGIEMTVFPKDKKNSHVTKG